MSFDLTFVYLVLVVAIAFTTEVAAGFGSMVVAMGLGLHLYSVHTLAPLLVALNTIVTGYIVFRHHDHIDRELLTKTVLPVMAAGMLGGLVLFNFVSAESLRLVFAVFVVCVSVRELIVLFSASPSGRSPLPRRAARAGILGAGVIHGMFATGGPLLVYVLGRLDLDKRGFRSTLATVWLTLNSTLLLIHIFSGRFTADSAIFAAALLPVLLLCIAMGEWAHSRLDEQSFRKAVFALLLASGVSLLV